MLGEPQPDPALLQTSTLVSTHRVLLGWQTSPPVPAPDELLVVELLAVVPAEDELWVAEAEDPCVAEEDGP